jgi:hypothetical protein
VDTSEPYLRRVLDIARVIHASPDLKDDALVPRLQQAGLAPLDAELAVVFVPVAFARVILGQMGAGPFPDTYLVQNRKGAWVERVTSDEPWYRAAVRVAAATVVHGYGSQECADAPTKDEFGAAVDRSPEMALASDLLDAKGDLTAATFHPLRLLRVTAESFAPRPWWQVWRGER